MTVSLGMEHRSTFTSGTAANWSDYGFSWGTYRSGGIFSVTVPVSANYYTWRDLSGNTSSGLWGQIPVAIVRESGGGSVVMSNNVWTLTAGTNVITGTAYAGTQPAPTPTPPPPTPTPTPTPPPLDTLTFEHEFGAGLEGKTVSIYDAQGNLLGQWTVPTGGGVISASVSAESLEGAYWDIDGVLGSIDDPLFNPSMAVQTPEFSLSFDRSYSGGEFQIRRNSDGSVAGSGPVGGSFEDPAIGRVTIGTGDSATVWTRVPAGDGMGSVWVPTEVSLSGTNRTTYAFVANPNPQPLPTPNFPTNAPAPITTNAPAPVPSPGTNTVGSSPVATNDVSVDVEALDPIAVDDGEQAVLDGVRSASEKLRGILEDLEGAFDNVALTFNEFRKFTLGGVGSTCTFTLGDVTINLANIVPPWLRQGMKLAILIVAVFAMIRYTWETFR